MAKKLNFDVTGNVEDYTFVLSTRGFIHQGQINTAVDVIYKANFNAADELSFTVYKQLDDVICYTWDLIKDLKLIFVPELEEYFEIGVSMDETDTNVKHITAVSLCEAELSQIYLYNVEINTENDILREEYLEPTIFYKEGDPANSLLDRLLEKAPHYRIGHVDDTLRKIQRTFSFDGATIYDVLTGDISQEIGCLFLFDTMSRTINVYDLETTCQKCKHRGVFFDACPECGGIQLIPGYGQETAVFISRENLASLITVTVDKDSIKNCLRIRGGDDMINATVRNCIPNGSEYLTLFCEEQLEDMSVELKTKLAAYQELLQSRQEEYREVMKKVYQSIDDALYFQSGMMPTVEMDEITVDGEMAKLTAENLSPLSVSSLSKFTAMATINSAIKNYAKIFVHSRYQIEVSGESWTYNEKTAAGSWQGHFTLTNYGDEEDTMVGPTITIAVNTDYENFLVQKIEKTLKAMDNEDHSIYDVVNIAFEEPDTFFNDTLKLYGLSSLKSFYDMYQRCINILEEEKQANANAEIYEAFFTKYRTRLDAITAEMALREATIEEINDGYAELMTRQQEIRNELDLEKYLGIKLWNEYSAYRREDTYENQNYISEGLDNKEIFAKAEELIEVAQREIEKSSTYQRSLSTTMNNLLASPEFAPITDNFTLGNWLRVEADGEIYRLRLISYQIDFNAIQDIPVEFSDITRSVRACSDLESIYNSVKGMSTNYSYIARQAAVNNSVINGLIDKLTTSHETQEALKNLVDSNFTALTEQIVSLNKQIDDLTTRVKALE